MNIKIHQINSFKIAEVLSEQLVINKVEDGIELVGNLYYQGFDKIIIYQKNIIPSFFDLKTRIAGEILQKFSTYRVGLAIVGDFSIYHNKNLQDFIYESNKNKHINFVDSLAEALEKMSI